MLIPKFTIRQMMIAMIAFGVVSAILGYAFRGSYVAYGMGLAIIGLFIPLLTYAAFFWVLRPLVGRKTIDPSSENLSQMPGQPS